MLNFLSNKSGFWYFIPSPLKTFLDRLESSPMGQRLARGAFWTLVGTLVSRGMNMVAMVLVARMLGRSEFGEIGIIQSTIGMFQTLAGFGLGWAATKYVAEFRNTDPERTGRIIAFSNLTAAGTGGVIALAFFAAVPWLAEHTLAAPHLVRPLQIGSLVLLLSTLAGTQNGTLAGFEAFKPIARINLITGVLGSIFIIGGAWFGDVEGSVWGLAASCAANWFLNLRTLRTETRQAGIQISWMGCWQERRVLWDYSTPAILGGTVYNIANWVCATLLVNRQGGYAEMGYYNAANQWFSALLFLPGVLGQAAIPVLSEGLGKNDLSRSRKIFAYSIKLNSAVMMPVVIMGCICSPWIMRLYGDDFKVAWPTLLFTLFAAGISALQAPAAQIIAASGKMWMGMIMNSCWAVIFVTSTWGIINLGSLGLAIARCIAYSVYMAWSFKFAYSLIREPPLPVVPFVREL